MPTSTMQKGGFPTRVHTGLWQRVHWRSGTGRTDVGQTPVHTETGSLHPVPAWVGVRALPVPCAAEHEGWGRNPRSPVLVSTRLGVMVSWCLLPGPAPVPGQSSTIPQQVQCPVAQRSCPPPPTRKLHSALGRTVQAVHPGLQQAQQWRLRLGYRPLLGCC